MTSNRFFIEKLKLDTSPFLFLSGKEHHHLSRVARTKPRETVWLFDGKGTSYLARVEEISREKTRLKVLKTVVSTEPKVRISLGQAILKAKKMEHILQKATELGITTFIPIMSERSVIRIQDRAEKKTERWEKIAREASKQSGRSFSPSVLPPLPLSEFLEVRDEEKKLFLSENRGVYLKDLLLPPSRTKGKTAIPSSVSILVGPEGGWSEEEEDDIVNHGYEAVCLGELVLRAETAAISSVALISHFWNL